MPAQFSPDPLQGNGPATAPLSGGGASPRPTLEQRRKAHADDETCRLLINVLWTLRAHLHGDTPIRTGTAP